MSIAEMCALAEQSRAGYYRFLTTPAAGDKDIDLRDAIQRIALEFPTYGRPRMTEELHRRGWQIGPNRVYRIMREDNLLCLRRRKFVVTTNSNHDRPVYPNLARDMVLTGIDREQTQIVNTEVWQRVQQRLKSNGRIGGYEVRNKYGAILKGILRCKSCDAGMIHTYTKKTANKLYRYYVCVTAHQHGWNKCPTRSVSAPAIEEAVVAQIRGLGASPAMIEAVVGELEEDHLAQRADLEQEKRVAERELRRINEEIAAVIRPGVAQGPGARLATDRLADLQDRASALERRMGEIRNQLAAKGSECVDRAHVSIVLRDFDRAWQQMTPREQEKLVKSLVHHVTYDGPTEAVTVAFRSAALKQMCIPASI